MEKGREGKDSGKERRKGEVKRRGMEKGREEKDSGKERKKEK